MGRGGDLSKGYVVGRVVAVYGPALGKFYVPGRTVQQMSGDVRQLLPRFLHHVVKHGAAGDDAPAGGGAAAVGQDGGVAVTHPYVARRNAEFVGDHLGEGGLRALAVGRDAGVDLNIAVRPDDAPRMFFEHGYLCAGALDHRRKAYTDERPTVLRLLAGAFPAIPGSRTFPGSVQKRRRIRRNRR